MHHGMVLLKLHTHPEVWETIRQACRPDNERIGRIEGEEPDPWDAVEVDVYPHVELMRGAQDREWGEKSRSHVPQCERHDADPGAAFKGIKA
jgi:hypothetical protein